VTCDEVEELLGAYALDALPPDEEAAVRAHLASCQRHAHELASLRDVASRLAETTAAPPPPSLRARVLAAVASDASAAGAASPAGASPVEFEAARTRVASRRRLDPFAWSPRAWAGIAAALLIAVVALAAWNAILLRGGASEADRLAARVTWVASLQAHGVDARGAVAYVGDEHKAIVFVDGLRPLGPSQTYQLWSMDGGTPESIGLMNTDTSGKGTMVVPFDATRAHTLAVTVERAGGSPQPTSSPILVASCIAGCG